MASISAIAYAGALPVLAEVDASLNLDPADVEARITPRTKAIMVVHMLGNPARQQRTASMRGAPYNAPGDAVADHYRPGMLPRTDAVVNRAMSIGIGVSDPNLGSTFGVTVLDGQMRSASEPPLSARWPASISACRLRSASTLHLAPLGGS